jgi:hypothetical protein
MLTHARAHGLLPWHSPFACSLSSARSPTSASSERAVSKAPHSEPWKEDGGSGPYQYHPGGDTSIKKDAPSALNVVVIPNVTLPKARYSALRPTPLSCVY